MRYALRPPIAQERLTRAGDGRGVQSLRRPLYDGTTAVAFTPMELMKRLAAMVPPPRRNTVRYFGVFAARAGIRARVVSAPGKRRRPSRCEAEQEEVQGGDHGLDDQALAAAIRAELGFNSLALGPPPMPERARRLDWAGLLERVIQADVLQCAGGGRRKVTAFIPSGRLARQILERLGVDATGPPIAKARRRPRQEHLDLAPDDPGVDPQSPD